MKIAGGKQVSLEYTLQIDDGTVVDSNVGGDPLTYLHGADEILPALERQLEGLEAGDSRKVTISPEDGYGPVHQEAIQEVATEQIPVAAREIGARLQASAPDGEELHARVTEIREDTIVIDFNHPLAGEQLHFEVKVLDVRDTAAS